jgi:DNA-binding beta-propeller fold protein YncE
MFKLCSILVSILLMAGLPGASALAHGESLKLLWETAGFMNPESVVYDPANDVLYVSNVNGEATAKDGNGFISRVTLAGEIRDLEWVKGLNAPKGLAVHGGKLYVADIDTLVAIDIKTGAIVERHRVADARFLNDVAAGPDGAVYVSDMMLNRIHRLRDGQFEIWLENPALESPNGLLVQGDKLIVGAWGVMSEGFNTPVPGHMKSVSLSDKFITALGDGAPVGNLDGVEADLDGDYYVTDWMAGKLLHIKADGEYELLLTLSQGSADHAYLPAGDILVIPMMMDNKLLAYKAHAGGEDD